MRGTKEFHELRYQFEKDIKETIYGHKLDRQEKNEKVPVDVFYNDGFVNKLFHAYMMGYQNGKWIERNA